MPKIYSMEVFAAKCIVEITLNGLFLFRKNAKIGTSINYPCNTELIEKGNTLTISAYPTLLDDGKLSSVSDVEIVGTIKTYGENEITGPESGQLVQAIDFSDIIKQRESEAQTLTDLTKLFPISKSFLFDNDGLSFRNRLVDSPIIKDEILLLDYAEKLRSILETQDIELLWAEYKPKIDDYAIAYPQEFPKPFEWFLDFMNNDFFPGGPITNFKRSDIGLRSWCNGRVWELFIKPSQEFITNQGLDGDINSIEVYVAMIDGKLKIIR